MKRVIIGYIHSGKKLGPDEIMFKKIAKKKNVEVVLISTAEWVSGVDLKEKIKNCDIIYNSSAEDFAIETEKTIEKFGKKIIDSSKAYYYIEDKWMFYLECLKNKIPVPRTILLSENISVAKKELKEFNEWPVILKRVIGTMGEYVEKAENPNEAKKIIKKFWANNSEKLPIIAQEYIFSPSYRVTVIGGKIMQTAIKQNNNWKATGVYAKKIKRFPVDNELEKIVKRIMGFVNINICGIDFLKKNNKWIALEVNSAPAFDFFESERKKLTEELIQLLIRLSKKH